MKKLLIPILTLLIFSCKKEDKVIHEPKQLKHFGVIGNLDQDYARFRRGGGKGKPVKDTVVITPPDTTVIPVDTVPTTDPAPLLLPAYSIEMSTPLNQGGEGSCVSFSVLYAREREQYNKTGVWVALSQEYLFNQTKSSTDSNCSGSAIITALNFLLTNGVCTNASLPYSWTNGCSIMPTEEQIAEAANYRISDYLQIWVTDSIGIKQALLANHPLVIQVPADQALTEAGPGFIWKTLGQIIGYHSLTICGYDDSRHAFNFINSWGTSWGDSGYGWIDYDLFTKISSSAMKIIN